MTNDLYLFRKKEIFQLKILFIYITISALSRKFKENYATMRVTMLKHKPKYSQVSKLQLFKFLKQLTEIYYIYNVQTAKISDIFSIN